MSECEPAVAYTDESGNLSDPNDRYVAFAAIVTSHPDRLRRIVKKASRKLKKARLKRRTGQEIKWWNAPDGTRRRVLEALARQEVQVFWLVVDKENEGIPDTPENYGLMLGELVRECLAYHPDLRLMTDVHFSGSAQREALNQVLIGRTGLAEKPMHLESQQDSIIQLADFVAGAILYWFTGKGDFVDLIEGKVVAGKVVKWQQLAKKKR